MNRRFIIKLLFFVLLFIITPNVYASSTSVYVSGYENYGLIQEELNLINAERLNEGLEPLILDETLTYKAMVRAHEIAVSYSHIRPDGSRNFSVFDDISYTAGGENIVAGQYSSSEVMNDWMNSYDHMKNIMAKSSPASRFKSVGLGHFQVNGYNYWVQLFSDYVGNPLYRYDISYYEGYIYVNFSDGETFGDSLYGYFNKSIDLNINDLYSIFENDPVVYYNYNNISVAKTSFSYYSEDNNIASINENGVITACGSGATTIHAILNGVDYVLNINVNNPINESYSVVVNDINSDIFINNNYSGQTNSAIVIVNDNKFINDDLFINNNIKSLSNKVNSIYFSFTDLYLSDDDMIIIDESEEIVMIKTRGYILIFGLDYIKRFIV